MNLLQIPNPDGIAFPRRASSGGQSNRGRINVGCPTGSSIWITTRPMTLNGAVPDPGLPYHATLAASGSPAGGMYNWTTDNPGMIHFDNPAASSVNITVGRSGKANITVTYTNQCGATSQDSLTFVLTDDITVVGWLDRNAIQLPGGASDNIVRFLNRSDLCGPTLLSWENAGEGLGPAVPPVTTSVDRQYATAWLNIRSANSAPPLSLPSSFNLTKTAFRAFNQFKAYYEVTPIGISGNTVKYLQGITDVGSSPAVFRHSDFWV